MKNTMYLFGILLLTAAIVVSSCKKDDDDPTPVDLSPVMTFIGGAGYTDSDAEMAPSSAFKVGINASENLTSKSDIKSYVVVRTFNNTPTTVFEDDDINEANYSKELDLIANTQAGEERWTFTITDKDGQNKQLSIVITTVFNISVYKNVTMGSFNDTTYGSFMATATGTVMTKAEASADQGSVDFAFYLGAINKSTFGAPANDDIKAVFNLTGLWTIFNNTLFDMAGINATEFDAIGGSYIFPEFTGTENEINNLEADDVVFFKTVNNKLGYIKVNTINGKGDQINIDVIVQE